MKGKIDAKADEVKKSIGRHNEEELIINTLKHDKGAIPIDYPIDDLAVILQPAISNSNVLRLYKFLTSPKTKDFKGTDTLREYAAKNLKKRGLDPNLQNDNLFIISINEMIDEANRSAMKADTIAENEGELDRLAKEGAAEYNAKEEKKEENNKSVSTPSEWKKDLPMNPEQWKKDKPEKKNRKWRKLLNSYIRYLVGKAGLKSESPEYKHLAEIATNAENTSAWFDSANAAFDYVKSLLESKGKGFPKKQLQGKSRALQLISKTGSKMPSKKQLHKCLNKKEIKELYGLMQGGSVSKTVQSSPHWSIKIKGGAMELTQYNNNTLSLSSPSELSEYNSSATALANSASTNAVIPAGATWKSVSDDMMALASLATGTKPAEVVEQLNKMNRVRAEIAHRDYVNKFIPANLRSKTIQRIPLKAAMIATDAIKKKQITDKVINDIRGYPGLSKQQSDALRSLLKMKGNRVKQFKKILGIN